MNPNPCAIWTTMLAVLHMVEVAHCVS